MPTSFELTPEMMREIIMDHYSSPRHKHIAGEDYLKLHSHSANCIDDIDVFVKIGKDGKIVDACWDGVACAISTASTDILCDLSIGLTKQEEEYLIEQFLHMIHQENFDASALDEALAFANTYRQPARIHCATIGYQAIKDILEGKHE